VPAAEPEYDDEILTLRNQARRLQEEIESLRSKLNGVSMVLTDILRSSQGLADGLLKKYDKGK
jgi:prefoldin subunit 5